MDTRYVNDDTESAYTYLNTSRIASSEGAKINRNDCGRRSVGIVWRNVNREEILIGKAVVISRRSDILKQPRICVPFSHLRKSFFLISCIYCFVVAPAAISSNTGYTFELCKILHALFFTGDSRDASRPSLPRRDATSNRVYTLLVRSYVSLSFRWHLEPDERFRSKIIVARSSIYHFAPNLRSEFYSSAAISFVFFF